MRRVGFQSVQDTIEYGTPSYEKGGVLCRDDIVEGWFALTMVAAAKPQFFKMRSLPNYVDLLRAFPEWVFLNAKGKKPEDLLKDEAAFDDFIERFAKIRREDPNSGCYLVVRMIVGNRPA